MLVAKYEIFFMKKDKSIVSMIIRFTNIINDLKDLDCKFTNDELVNNSQVSTGVMDNVEDHDCDNQDSNKTHLWKSSIKN